MTTLVALSVSPSARGGGNLPSSRQRSAVAQFVLLLVMRDGGFLGFTIVTCVVAAIVASFQYSVYTSFVRSAAVMPQLIGGDIWISTASVDCFDFPTPFSEDYSATVARYFGEVRFRRVAFGFAP